MLQPAAKCRLIRQPPAAVTVRTHGLQEEGGAAGVCVRAPGAQRGGGDAAVQAAQPLAPQNRLQRAQRGRAVQLRTA